MANEKVRSIISVQHLFASISRRVEEGERYSALVRLCIYEIINPQRDQPLSLQCRLILNLCFARVIWHMLYCQTFTSKLVFNLQLSTISPKISLLMLNYPQNGLIFWCGGRDLNPRRPAPEDFSAAKHLSPPPFPRGRPWPL